MKESILTASEKEYLSNVIKPFRKKSPITIGRYVSAYDTDEEYIIIWMSYIDNPNVKETITFPYFKAGEMYRGMEIDKEYSLEELGL